MPTNGQWVDARFRLEDGVFRTLEIDAPDDWNLLGDVHRVLSHFGISIGTANVCKSGRRSVLRLLFDPPTARASPARHALVQAALLETLAFGFRGTGAH